uniref:DUF2997 domain-containing protein n=1 Tax=Desulfobacca acetoxidans TaxID=60893 RepID=A0A7V4LD44_9BACT
MSNTSSVSPYEATPAAPGFLATCGAAVVQWLSESTAADRAAVARLEEDRRAERLKGNPSCLIPCNQSSPLRLTSVGLHLHNPESLMQSAQKLGYQVVPLSFQGPLESQPVMLLQRPSGERLAIERNPAGKLVIHTACEPRTAQSLVRQHSMERALDHLRRKGGEVQTATLANGEIQIQAQERQTGQPGGTAKIKVQIHLDGRAWVDIEGVRGNRCEQIVGELASAMGAQVSSCQKKDAYYQLPGEPVKIRQQV